MSDIARPDAADAVLEGRILARLWFRWVSRVTDRLNGREPMKLRAYTVATLPAAVDWKNHAAIVTDEVGGATIAVSDGTSWLRVADGTEVT